MTFDYKKYSLENLEKWIEDAINSSEASPQEIYDVVKNVVKDNYYCYKNHTERCYELLALLNGSGKGHLSCDKDDRSSKYQKSWNDFWEENYYPEESSQYTEEELNAMCDKAASDEEKNKCREYNLREAEYYNQRVRLDAECEAIKAAGGYEWTPDIKKDRVVKWILPVHQVKNWVLPPGTKPGSDIDYVLEEDYVINFPEDLLEAADLKEGDQVEWIDQGDGSYLLRKV